MVLRADERTEGPSTAALSQRNGLLAALPEAELGRLGPDLGLVDLGLRQLLYEVDRPITAVYFPVDCVVSVVRLLEGEMPIEVSTVGAEGMAGLPAFLGADISPTRSFCQVPGQALRLEVPALRQFLAAGSGLAALLLRYTRVVMAELAQNVACNQLHSTEERCARWLAQTDDRVEGDVFPMTQDFLAQMLGVRRATVSLSARLLQQAGLIRYSRGRITVLDRDGLHAAACSCYRTLQREIANL